MASAANTDEEIHDLEDLLEHIDRAANTDHQHISVAEILRSIGTRSFAPLILLSGILIASPLSGIPGLPTVVAVIVIVVSSQMLVGRDHFWLPDWLLKRSVPKDKMQRAIKWLKPPARFFDHLIRPRLTILVKGPSRYLIAAVCLALGLAMPVMEFVPFSSSVAGTTLAAFGLAIVAYDGILALLAYLATGATTWFILQALLF